MAELNFPSMFDTRHAMDRQMQEDAHKAGMAAWGGKRYGMYYNSSLLGDQDIARKRSIGGMFGLGGDPRMQQQQALDEIMARFPNPQTPDDFVEISNALSGVGLHSYAEAAMDMANETRSSMPKSTYTTVKVGDTDEKGNRITTTWLYKDGVPFKELGSQATDAPSTGKSTYQNFKTEDEEGNDITETYVVGSDGLIVEGATPVFTQKTDSTKTIENYDETLINRKKQTDYIDAEKAKDYKKMNEIIFEHKRAYEALNDAPAQTYSSEIADIMDMINGETMKGGSLYDPVNHPDGRKFTRLEAERKYEENKRETSEQKLIVKAGEEDIKYTNKLITETDDAADQANRDLQSFRNILNAYEAGGRTGKWEEAILSVKGILRTLGFKGDINELVGSEVLLAEFNKIALSRMSQLSGSASDKDVAFVVSGGPSYDKSPEANMLLIQQAMHLSNEAQHQNEFLNKYVSQYLQNHNGNYPKSWELNAAMEAFRNRGDIDENAVQRYGHIWNSADFQAVGSRESLVGIYGNNQFDGWGKYEKIQSGEIGLVNATMNNQAILDRARQIAAEE